MLRSKIECVRIVFSVASRYSIGEIALQLFQANEYKWRGIPQKHICIAHIMYD